MNEVSQDQGPHVLAESITQLATGLGAISVGIAPVERFWNSGNNVLDDGSSYAPTGYSPEELLPGARSVIVVVVRIPDGVVASNLSPIDTTYAFGNFGYVHLNRLLNSITHDLARFLEERSWTSLPLGPCGSTRFDRAGYEEGRTIGPLHGIFNLKRAALLAGIGGRARSGLVATPHHGTRIRLGAVITTAMLNGSPVLAGTSCPPGCKVCIESCPMDAINGEGQVDHVACFSDQGRRGHTPAESLHEMAKAVPLVGAASGYLPHEHTAIDGVGNRQCRVLCMAMCPLVKVRQ